MPRLAIDREFLQDYAKLDKPVQALVNDVFGKFEAVTHTGIHLEPVQNAKDRRLRTIRINQFWRGVVLAPQSSGCSTTSRTPTCAGSAWTTRPSPSPGP